MGSQNIVVGWGRAARIAGCSPGRIRGLVARGELRTATGSDGAHSFRVADLEALRAPTASAGESEEGPLAAAAFQQLDAGGGPAALVKAFKITPEAATRLYQDWRAAQFADTEAATVRKVVGFLRTIPDGWTVDDVVNAYARVVDAQRRRLPGSSQAIP